MLDDNKHLYKSIWTRDCLLQLGFADMEVVHKFIEHVKSKEQARTADVWQIWTPQQLQEDSLPWVEYSLVSKTVSLLSCLQFVIIL